jgi:hypothetical protein
MPPLSPPGLFPLSAPPLFFSPICGPPPPIPLFTDDESAELERNQPPPSTDSAVAGGGSPEQRSRTPMHLIDWFKHLKDRTPKAAREPQHAACSHVKRGRWGNTPFEEGHPGLSFDPSDSSGEGNHSAELEGTLLLDQSVESASESEYGSNDDDDDDDGGPGHGSANGSVDAGRKERGNQSVDDSLVVNVRTDFETSHDGFITQRSFLPGDRSRAKSRASGAIRDDHTEMTDLSVAEDDHEELRSTGDQSGAEELASSLATMSFQEKPQGDDTASLGVTTTGKVERMKYEHDQQLRALQLQQEIARKAQNDKLQTRLARKREAKKKPSTATVPDEETHLEAAATPRASNYHDEDDLLSPAIFGAETARRLVLNVAHRSRASAQEETRQDEDEALTSVTSDADIWMRQIAVTSERALSLSPVDSLGSVGSRNECDEPGSESIIDSSDAEHEPPSIPTQPRSSCRAVSSTRYRLPFFDTATKSVETSLTKRVAAGRKVAENNSAHEVLLEDDILDSSLSTIDNGNDECFSTGGVDTDTANEPDLQAAAAAAAAAARSEVTSDDDFIDSPPLDDEFDASATPPVVDPMRWAARRESTSDIPGGVIIHRESWELASECLRALIESENTSKSTLVVGSRGQISRWCQLFAEEAPHLRVLNCSGRRLQPRLASVLEQDVVLCTFETLSRHRSVNPTATSADSVGVWVERSTGAIRSRELRNRQPLGALNNNTRLEKESNSPAQACMQGNRPDKGDLKDQLLACNSVLHKVHWERLIVDDAHQILAGAAAHRSIKAPLPLTRGNRKGNCAAALPNLSAAANTKVAKFVALRELQSKRRWCVLHEKRAPKLWKSRDQLRALMDVIMAPAKKSLVNLIPELVLQLD